MSLEYIFILISIGAVALGFVVLTVFGVRNFSRGKHNVFSVATIVVPFVVFGICAVITGGEMAKSAILTVIIMAVLAIAGLLYSGVRGLTG
ncbi:MAG TPA: hypothetical protein VJB15_01095 [Rhodothermia bacterium]|nr:hypothetical protein [Rhodothermia bacterium]